MDKYRIHSCLTSNSRDLIYQKFYDNKPMIEHEKQIINDLGLMSTLDINT